MSTRVWADLSVRFVVLMSQKSDTIEPLRAVHPVHVIETQLRARMWAFLTDDDPHPRRPTAQVYQSGQFGDPGAVTYLVVCVAGRGPGLVGDLGEQVGGVRGQGEPDRIGQALAVSHSINCFCLLYTSPS